MGELTTKETAQFCCNGCQLGPDEAESPRRSDDGTVWCDECFNRLFTYNCCKCGNREHEDNQHRYLVVFDAEEAGMEQGVYRIVDKPYMTAALIGSGWLHPEALHKVGEAIKRGRDDGFPCGHLCVGCSEEYELVKGPAAVNTIRTQW